MKKITLLSLVLSSFLMAQDYKYELTPVIGYNIAEGNLDLKNQNLIGAEFQYNGCDSGFSPELSVLYTDADYDNVAGANSTDIYRIAVNGVKEFDKIGPFTPLAKAGLGYETIDKHYAGNKDSVFVDAGVGAKLPLMDHLALKLEAVYMLKNNDNRWDNNLALLAGLTFAFGEDAPKAAPAAPVAATTVVKEEPKPVEPAKEEPKAAEPVAVVAATAAVAAVAVDGDDDNDGVLNSKDKCPTTAAGAKVNEDGCSVEAIDLHIKFKTNSSEVDAASLERIKKYAKFMKENPEYSAQIIGHTDNVGNAKSNQALSEKRANIVKDLAVKEGADASRITAKGMGESKPMVSNKTADGRAKNRRIEAVLTKK